MIWKTSGGVPSVLTPMDIHNKQFKKKMRGYDEDEVNEFLNEIITDFEQLLTERKETKNELEEQKKRLAQFENIEESLNKSIVVAQEAADKLKENSQKESDNIVQEAQNKADKIIQDAQNNADTLLKKAVEQAQKIEQETEELRKQSRVFRQRLQLMVESQLELITDDQWENVLAVQEIPEAKLENIQKVSKDLEDESGLKEEAETNETESDESNTVDVVYSVNTDEEVEDEHRPAEE